MDILDEFLSPHFKLRELVRSTHRLIDNTPNSVVIGRLRHLCTTLLEPIRNEFGPLLISSGYRCPALNKAVGGSSASAHMYGCAADFMPADRTVRADEVVKWIRDYSKLPYDQVIDERSNTASWVHIGMVRPGQPSPRRQVLAMRGGVYLPFKDAVT